MAKKAGRKSGDGANKSQAIRDYLKQNPGAGPTAVASALNSSEGWKISAAYVSTIKNKMNQPSRSSKRGPRKASAKVSRGSGLESSLMQAKAFIDQAGGINQAKAALDLLAKLTS